MIDYNTLTKQEKIVYDNWIPGIHQDPRMTDEQAIEDVISSMRRGYYYVVEYSGVLLLIYKETYWVGRVHIFSENKKYNYITAGKTIFKHVFDNSDLQIVYGYTSQKKFLNTVVKGGMECIGILEKSYKSGEKFADQYIFSVQREKFYDFLEKNPISEENV
jgi:hypothetical protein